MSADVDTQRVLAPLQTTTRRYYVLLAILLFGGFVFFIAWVTQLREGMWVTGLSDWGTPAGVPWGLYIGSFIWWIGIAHGGIFVSAAVRVFKVDRFKPIARIGEVLTLVALPMAAANIVFDLGRPDRVFNTIQQWPLTVHHSPLAWDVTVVSLYFVLSITYLVFSLRDEIYALRSRLPGYAQPIYSVILLGYTPGESEKVEQMTWWLAVAILAIVPLLSGGVVPWLFGLIGFLPGWYGAGTGPAMLTESLTTAVALVIVAAAAFRFAYGWDDMIDDDIFKGLNLALVFLTIATLFFLLHDVLTGIYLAPAHISVVTETLVAMPLFWAAAAVIAIAHVYLLSQALGWIEFTFPGTVLASIGVALAILVKKVLFVVEGLMYPSVPPVANLYETGQYVPSLVELAIMIGSLVVAALLFVIIAKIIPMVELPEHSLEEEMGHDVPDRAPTEAPGTSTDTHTEVR